jgi:D-beta-D-heptose 7-phosphate kinase/D-beta-D-heptose 1-phosphate adenosyltransferase
MLDRYIKGRADRISPEAPIPILDVADEYQMPGGAANVAAKATDLGSSAILIGLVGADDAAAELRALLSERRDIAQTLIPDPQRPTSVKTRFLAHNQQLLRVDREGRSEPAPGVRDRLVDAANAATRQGDVVILSDYGKGVVCEETILAVIDGAQQNGARIVVDPNGRNYRRYKGVTLLTPNLKETEIAAERPVSDLASLELAANLLVEQTGAALAVTREAEGISLFRPAHGTAEPSRHTHVPTVPVPVYDVTGAGDVVAATLAIAVANGIDMIEACALANLAGRAVVRQYGVGVVSLHHLIAETQTAWGDTSTKIASVAHARQQAREVQRRGRKVVFTNGCFDLLHQGHALLLQFARNQGDYLILGLNTDASVRRLKGPERPFLPELERSYMLSLYPFVDLVVMFDDDTPIRLIEAIRPDVLVKGGDYRPDTIVGRDLVESYGGQVVICSLFENLSTTSLVRKIKGQMNPGESGR